MRLPLRLALLALLALAAGCEGEGDTANPGTSGTSSLTAAPTVEASPSPAATGSPAGTASPSPTSTPSVSFERARLGDPIEVAGQFLVTLVATGTDAAPHRVERVDVAADGTVTRSTVLEPDDPAFGGAYINSWRNIHHPPAGSADGVVVTLCAGGKCGGLGPADADADTVLLRTPDAGQTWEELGDLDGAYWITSWASSGEVLLYDYPAEGEPAAGARFRLWPSMAEVRPPGTSQGSALEDHWPHLLPDGRVAWWWTGGLLIDGNGNTVLDLAEVSALGAGPIELLASPDGERLVVTWEGAVTTGVGWYWTLFERISDGRYQPVRTLAPPDELSLAVPYSWLSDHEVIIPASADAAALGLPADTRVGAVPAVVDFDTGEVRPIAGFLTPEDAGAGTLVVGVLE